ncbi:MAG: 3-oxoacyl-[acyl-carrier-protein] reductase [Eubacteriales bacterium]
MSTTNKVAFITGGSRGIGSAICMDHAKNGYDIALNYAGNEAKAQETKAACEAYGVQVLLVQGDVSSDEAVSKMVANIVETFGGIHVLVNNAGITKDNLLMRMSEADFDAVVDTNLKGSYLCMKHVIRTMMKQRYGRIVNMSSVVGIAGNAGQMNYAASKAGVIGMTKSLAKEVGSRGITVNAVAPGYIETDMTSGLLEEHKEAIATHISLGRLGTPEDIAKTVSFLTSENASYITGQVIAVDGGMSL